jgi:hypothetical protein
MQTPASTLTSSLLRIAYHSEEVRVEAGVKGLKISFLDE